MPVYLNDYNYIVITNTDLKQIDQKLKKRENYSFKTIQESENSTAKDLVEKVLEQDDLPSYNEGRLWKVDKLSLIHI